MDSGKKLPYDENLGKRILDLRQGGYTWRQIDQLLFPGLIHKDKKSGSFAGDFCVKHRKTQTWLEGAFSKQVIGGFTATQIVVPIRKFTPFQKKEDNGRITMADLGL